MIKKWLEKHRKVRFYIIIIIFVFVLPFELFRITRLSLESFCYEWKELWNTSYGYVKRTLKEDWK